MALSGMGNPIPEHPCLREIQGRALLPGRRNCEMKKRFLSLLCVLALCLGLLPVTALAAGEIELYVGGQKITESGCYENQNGTWKKVDGTEPDNGQFSYDAATATLTLNQAKIVNYKDVTVGGGFTYPGSVIAFSQSADVSLTIVVSQGTSNITGTGGIRVVSKAGDASLSISGPGSLEVNVDKNDSGISLIGSKNVNLNIDSADVKTLAAYYYGVDLHAGDGFKAAAVVNNGKLTAGGSGGIGIYYRWTNPSDNGTSSLTVSGNAVVDTRDSKILIASQASEVRVSAGSDGNGGIVFDGKSGTVYGDVTLQEDLEIGTDETLTIGKDASLTVPENVKLTNNGKIDNSGELNGTVDGSGTVTPKITTDSLPDGTVNQLYTATLQATGNGITWSLDSGSTLPSGLKLENDTISGTPTAAGTSTFIVKAENTAGSDSKELTLTISEPAPIYTISADVDPVGAGTVSGGGKYTAGTSVTLTATNNPGYRFVGWVESGTTVSTNPNYTFVANSNRSLTAQFDRISSGGGDSDPTYSITLPSRVTGGELKLSRRYAENGETVTLTAVPDEGYELDTLTVTDSKGNEIDLTHKGGNEYTFKMPAGRVEIEVSFREIEVELPFTDVPEGAWYADAAAYVYEHGLMAGTSATTFAPDVTTSRAMIATILWRMAGSPVVNYAMNYTDVAQGQWCSEAIRWATSEGVVTGYGNGLFGTNDPITREQFAVMLYRFAQEQGYDVSIGENTNILSYTDVADLSEYAIPAMQWAVGAGIINGTGDGSTLSPQGQATRAQAAVMLMRFCEE